MNRPLIGALTCRRTLPWWARSIPAPLSDRAAIGSAGPVGIASGFPEVTGILPLNLTVVWLVVGVDLGAATRRTLPAAFTALADYIALRFLVQSRYPTLQAPLTITMPVSMGRQRGVGIDPNSLRISGSVELVDAARLRPRSANAHTMNP
jgi:hypothetical protein